MKFWQRRVFFDQLVTRFGITLLLLLLASSVIAAPSKSMQDQGKTKLRHMVVFKFNDDANKEQIDTVVNAFRALKKKIPQIVSIESGTNNSPEHLNKGLTHAFLVTFSSEKDRDFYLVHRDHEKFKKLLLPLVSDVFVIDFFGKP